MSRLHIKLLRDLLAARWQFLAIIFIVVLGVGTFYGPLTAFSNLEESARYSYERLAFADVSVAMEAAPRAVLRQIERIPGVRAVEGRLVTDALLEQETGRRPRIIGRGISMPTDRPPAVNRVRLLQGRWLSNPPGREVLLEATFAQEHNYRPGDRVFPLIEGRRHPATVVGIVASPEYVYMVRSKQFRVPSPQTFGVLFVPRQQMEAYTGRAGYINEVVMLTDPGAAERVGRAVHDLLRPYGPQLPVPRAEQASNLMLQSDLKANKPIAVVVPVLLLASAGLAVSLVLARWVQAQQGQLGFLRAAGFSPAAILGHYLEAGLIVGLLGSSIGLVFGMVVAEVEAGMYAKLLRLPYQVNDRHPELAATAFFLALAACVFGAFTAARQAASIAPAVAMRGVAPPASSRRELAIKLPLVLALPLRNLMRRALHTIGTATGVASAVLLLVVSGVFWDSLDGTEQIYIRETLRYDASASFLPFRSETILSRIRSWPGVLRAEPTLELPIRVRHGLSERDTIIIGVPPDSRLRHLPDPSGKLLRPIPNTILSTVALYEKLGIERGDRLQVAYSENTRERSVVMELAAGPTVRQPVGLPVYMGLAEVQRRFAEPLGLPPDAVSGVLLQLDSRYLPEVRARLHRMDDVAAVQTQKEAQDQIRIVFGLSKALVGVLFILSGLVAFLVTHTAPEIVLWLRMRELATLRTLGFSMFRITVLISVENLVVALLGALAGIAPGIWLANYLLQISQTEGFSVYVTVLPTTLLIIIASILALAFIGQGPGLRRVARLQLSEVIRLRDE